MLLRREDLEGLALRLPDLVDVQDDVRLEIALLGLVRLEQEDRRGRIGAVRIRLVAGGLGDDAGLLREARRLGMVDIVGVLERVGQHEGRLQLVEDVDGAIEHGVGGAQGIVAGIHELDLGSEHRSGALSLVAALCLDVFHLHAGLLPGELALAAFAIGEAQDLHPHAAFGMERDGAAGAPDEIAGMGGDDEAGLGFRHARYPFIWVCRGQGPGPFPRRALCPMRLKHQVSIPSPLMNATHQTGAGLMRRLHPSAAIIHLRGKGRATDGPAGPRRGEPWQLASGAC